MKINLKGKTKKELIMELDNIQNYLFELRSQEHLSSFDRTKIKWLQDDEVEYRKALKRYEKNNLK